VEYMCFVSSNLVLTDIGSSCSDMSKDLNTRCSKSVVQDEDDSDWLHSNFTVMRSARSVQELRNMSTPTSFHGEESFAEKCTNSEKKRQQASSEHKQQRERERYSSMTNVQKEIWLQNNRRHKKLTREHNSPLVTPRRNTDMQTGPSNNNSEYNKPSKNHQTLFHDPLKYILLPDMYYLLIISFPHVFFASSRWHKHKQ
jgi:hypothetical protein